MAFAPECAVAIDVDEIPRRDRQRAQLLQQRARAGAADHAAIAEHQTGDAARRVQLRQQLAEGDLRLADGDEIGARAQIDLRRVRGVVTGHHDARARRARRRDHAQRRLPHPPQAHLREPVEDVVVDHDDVGPRARERRREPTRVVVEHRIVERDVVPERTQVRRRRDRRQRRIRFADRVLLAVEPQQMPVCKQDACHATLAQ